MHNTKTCTHCKQEKALEDFHKNKTTSDGHDTLCRSCRLTKSAVRRIINSGIIAEAKYKPCHCCGKLLHPKDIDLHHLDPLTKDFDVSKGKNHATPRLISEIEKCVPVCRPCHREIHSGDRRSS